MIDIINKNERLVFFVSPNTDVVQNEYQIRIIKKRLYVLLLLNIWLCHQSIELCWCYKANNGANSIQKWRNISAKNKRSDKKKVSEYLHFFPYNEISLLMRGPLKMENLHGKKLEYVINETHCKYAQTFRGNHKKKYGLFFCISSRFPNLTNCTW